MNKPNEPNETVWCGTVNFEGEQPVMATNQQITSIKTKKAQTVEPGLCQDARPSANVATTPKTEPVHESVSGEKSSCLVVEEANLVENYVQYFRLFMFY